MKTRKSIGAGPVEVTVMVLILGLTLPATPHQVTDPAQRDPTPGADREAQQQDEEPFREFDRRVAEMKQRMRQEMTRQREQSAKQRERDLAGAREAADRESLGATYAQWRVIKPRFKALADLHEQSAAMIRAQVSFSKGSIVRTSTEQYQNPLSCSWRWDRPSEDKTWEQLNPAERTCEELLDLLLDENTPLKQIWEKVEVLRRQKREAAAQVDDACTALREVLNPHQEAVLTVRGYLR